jgi:hypothetical protein
MPSNQTTPTGPCCLDCGQPIGKALARHVVLDTGMAVKHLDCEQWAADELERLRGIERAARRLIADGLRLTPEGLMVIENSDKTDPHYLLCKELGL